jgi:DNA-directed RNA polymerase specialized sigma24 family protein
MENADLATSVARTAAEISSPAFLEALPGYVLHAAYLLREKGMREGSCTAPAIEAWDVINDTVADCLSGVRRWSEAIPFSRFFRDAIRSKVYHRCHLARKRQPESIEDVDEPMAPSSRRIERTDACAELALVREALAGDPRTQALLDALENGAEKRAEIAEMLGWKPDAVTLARDAARRRLAAAGVRRDEKKKVG